jgi:hypothetical protein
MHPGAKPENELRDVPPQIAFLSIALSHVYTLCDGTDAFLSDFLVPPRKPPGPAPSTFLISFVLEKGRPSVNEKHGSRYRVGGVGA